MKVFILNLLILLNSISVASQDQIKIEVNKLNVIFSIKTDNILYKYGDTIYINYEIRNESDSKVFICDFEDTYYFPSIIDKYKIILYQHCGDDFNPDLGRGMPKLKILKPKKKLERLLLIPTSNIKGLTKNTETYNFCIYTGFIKYFEHLEYLSKSEKSIVNINSEKDFNDIVCNHHTVHLGNIQLLIYKPK